MYARKSRILSTSKFRGFFFAKKGNIRAVLIAELTVAIEFHCVGKVTKPTLIFTH